MTGRAVRLPGIGARPQILFVHESFPGQFGSFAVWLASEGWEVWFATAAPAGTPMPQLPGVHVLHFAPHRGPSSRTHPYAQPMDRAALLGQACARVCLEAREAGLAPDLVISHAGPGAGLYLGDVFPKAMQIAYCEWWYNSPGVDVASLAALAGETQATDAESAILEHSRNMPIMAELCAAGTGLCPTAFQAAQFPAHLKPLLRVEHDGVDTERLRPGPLGRPSSAALRTLSPNDRVISYATRGMEPHRGFPQAMEAIGRVQARDAEVIAVIAGENRVHYGGDALRQTDWKARALSNAGLDLTRCLFVGTLSPDDYLWLLCRTNAHLYTTVPFVLSWSMLDAMACAAPLVLSDTDPVREFATSDCALFADLTEPLALADAIWQTLRDPAEAATRARAARRHVEENWSQTWLFPKKSEWLQGLA